jgi:YD repeat-containing protein
MMRPCRFESRLRLRLFCLSLCYMLILPTTLPAAQRRRALTPVPFLAMNSLAAMPAEEKGKYRAGELLVRFRQDVTARQAAALAQSKGARQKQRLRGASRVERLEVAEGQDLEAVAAVLRLDPLVEFAELNLIIRGEQVQPDDTRFTEQWALRNAGEGASQIAGSDIRASQAWQVTTGSVQTVVAVVDGGVDFSHPDLINNRWRNEGELSNGRDDDRNGYENDLHGWDWVADSGEIKDGQGHGTAVAGLVAAEGDNAAGVAGVMWRASLMSLRVLDASGMGDVASAIEAIDYAVAKGAQVINCSWGTGEESQALRDAVARAAARGVVVVASAGNGGRDNDAQGYYPASYDLPNVIAVAGTDGMDNLAGWSNHGFSRVHVAAPGVGVLSTAKGGGYEAVDGTSAAAALVSGVAGLVKTLRPALKPERVREAVVRTARTVSGLEGRVASGGVVDASGALAAVSGWPSGPDFEIEGGTASPRTDEDANSGENGSGNVNGNGNGHGQGRGGNGAGVGNNNRPEPAALKGKFKKNQPNLDELRWRPSDPLRVATPIPSTRPDYVRGEPVRQPGGTIDADFVSTGRYTGNTLSVARLDPSNRTGTGGEDLFSGNFNWTLPLVSLPGRSGLDLGLSLSYNSLVWTKVGTSSVYFDSDSGFPSPGFRLGFPVVQAQFFNETTGKYAFLLVTPSGARVELRQVSAGSNIYEAADSSYLQLIDYGATKLVRTTDGTQLSYAADGAGQFVCTQIKDRNGNFLSVSYNAGRITSVTDTLGRAVSFNYDANNRLSTVTQARGAQQYQWAAFGYSNVTVSPSFPGMSVYGPVNTTLSLLTHVWTNVSALHQFTYNPFGQVYKIERKAPSGALLSQTRYNLPTTSTAHSDCPRFTERRDWVAEWNGDDGGTYSAAEEAVTTFGAEAGDVQTVTLPEGTTVKEFNHTSGWQRGLAYKTETWSSGVRKKWTTLDWAQDAGPTFRQNPRVSETNVRDAEGNRRRRTTVDYHASFGLPWRVTEYAADGATAIRHTYLDYKMDAAYIDLRVIGLPSQRQVYDSAGNLLSRVVYGYDWAGELFVDTPGAATHPATQHDRADYGPSFVVGRGNLQHVIRMDASDPGNPSKWQETKFRYDTVGALRAVRDQDWHESSFDYTDSFSDGVARDTFAYPTTRTDAGGHSSTAKYDFHTGAVTRTQDPKGAVREMQYDAAGRLEKVTTPFDGAFTQWSYPWTFGYVQQFSTVNNQVAESYSIRMLDGAGRVVSAATGHPYSQGGYRAQHFTFDVMGRMSSQTNPGEIDGWWTPAGDDSGGWQVTTQTYDWNGRPRVTTNPGPTTRTVTYEGCGCAGSQVVTTTDEVGRKRRATYDVLGRFWKSEVLNTDGSVYRTVTNTYNALDQITQVSDQAAGGATQITLMTYDGHGRLLTRKYPHESAPTTFTYKRDDRPETVTDGRGVTNTFTFDARHLLTGVDYGTATGVASTPDVAYAYDEAGNRTLMAEDGQARGVYEYDVLSRLKKETRRFPGLTDPYELNYEYNLAGQLKELKEVNTNAVTYYNYDSERRVHSVTAGGETYGGVSVYASGVKYRAWGALKSLDYGNNMWLSTEYDSRMRMSQFQVGGSSSPPGAVVMRSDYVYDADGGLRFASDGPASDGIASMYDRAYKYDHAGRLTEAFTSQLANDYNANGTVGVGGGQYIPYRQSYQYDAWGNQTSRDNWYWERQDVHTANFADNRRTELGWHYDGAGNLAQTPDVAMSYDAAGRNRVTASLNPGSKVITQWQDGDGQVVKRLEEGGGAAAETVYYLRSSALGGSVVAELNAQGVKTKGKIYLGGTLIAEHGEHQPSGARWVEWKHENPVTGKSGVSDADRYYLADYANLDSDGLDIGPPTLFYPGEGIPDERQPAAFFGDGIPDGRCTWEGMPIECAEVGHLLQAGAAMYDPGMESGRRFDPTSDPLHPRTEPFVRPILPIYDPTISGSSMSNNPSASGGQVPVYGRSCVGPGEPGGHCELYVSRYITLEGGGPGSFESQKALKPPSVKGASKDEQARFDAGYAELWKRLNANNGDNPCAALFGGIKKALEALKKTNFSVGATKNPDALAETSGKDILINSKGPFFDTGGSITFQAGINLATKKVGYITLDDVQLAAFTLLHELGHRTDTILEDRTDPTNFAMVTNNGLVRSNCFGDIKVDVKPLP